MATTQPYIELAQALPPRLLHFFKRFPPPQLTTPSGTQPRTKAIQIASNTSSSDPNAPSTTTTTTDPFSADTPQPATTTTLPHWKKNPFLASKNPTTGHWHAPHYSLRRQADLFRLATRHNVLPLMPTSPKHPTIKAAKRIQHGLRVKGTGEGQKVKGHHWERTMKHRLSVRLQAMAAMPDMITLWKERGHGRGWKKYPSGKVGKGGMAGGSGEVFRGEMRHVWVNQKVATS